MEWAFKGLLGLLGGVAVWIAAREVKRLDARIDGEVKRIDERVDAEVTHQAQRMAGTDSEVGNLRTRQHELGNIVATQGGSLNVTLETTARIEKVLERLDTTVTDLRVLIAETRSNALNGR